MWQNIIVGLCVLAAVVFVARRWIPGLGKKSSGCGSCNGCSSSGSSGSSSADGCGNSAEKGPH
ncbi:hypothetical protein ABA45_14575 [Marinobacter psychrophilus]|uniref:FeoB-associated Cys-rich membrane protein n=1 Tax=Marinobacter psychrophilus TaxID=330734 RepID=A0A0H4IET4_9GAMM|nr:FeoB-associated Cys-rich membrane protein [Marinobacter psychrophilus]AKO53492.1 hypothetical protein ABA45_14575 [Marinobacter psychrophilus]